MKILICESEEVLLTAIEFRLRKQGFNVAVCEKKASLPRALQEEKPDIVIIDLDMGKRSGLELVKEVKSTSDQASILLLADPEAEMDIIEGFELGIDDFIAKPFKPAELLLRVQRLAD